MSHSAHDSRPRLLACMLGCALLSGCGADDAPDDIARPAGGTEVDRVSPVQDALAGAHLPTLDPVTLHPAEMRKVLGEGPRCDFRYTAGGRPVVAVRTASEDRPAQGVLKLNGHLVALNPSPKQGPGELALAAGPVRIRVTPLRPVWPVGDERIEALAIFEVGEDLRVGYDGNLGCGPGPSAGGDTAG